VALDGESALRDNVNLRRRVEVLGGGMADDRGEDE